MGRTSQIGASPAQMAARGQCAVVLCPTRRCAGRHGHAAAVGRGGPGPGRPACARVAPKAAGRALAPWLVPIGESGPIRQVTCRTEIWRVTRPRRSSTSALGLFLCLWHSSSCRGYICGAAEGKRGRARWPWWTAAEEPRAVLGHTARPGAGTTRGLRERRIPTAQTRGRLFAVLKYCTSG